MTQLRLYDSLSRSVQPISPQREGNLSYYCCGPTVYGPAHIGNFRTFVVQDLFRRVAEQAGLRVTHVRNITDVDDKTIRESQAKNMSLVDFTTMWSERFWTDCKKLNLLEPNVQPSAVEHIPQQIELIEKLEKGGYAYQGADGSVYFRTEAFGDYGKLSRVKERELTSKSAEAVDADEYERDTVADFALWKIYKEADGPNRWESKWGDGRPGWHIECSAMAMTHLGETIDVHSGGIDLLFPHHENEIAQSECATGKAFVKHWFHVSHLMVEGQKMSKSLGNLYTLDDIEAKGFTGSDLRYALLLGHYRKQLNFSWDSIRAARGARERIGVALTRLRERGEVAEGSISNKKGEFTWLEEAWKALLNDLNSPEAFGQLFLALSKLGDVAGLEVTEAAERYDELMRFITALGVEPHFAEAANAPAEVVALAEARVAARKERNWEQADKLRAEINAAGWEVKDSSDDFELVPFK